jgi:hypothetical protein
MSKLIRGALLATLLCALPRCGGTDATEEPGAPSAGQGTGGTQAGDAGAKAGGSSGAGDLAQAGRASGGEAGTSHVGGATSGGAAGAASGGAAGAASGGAAGAASGGAAGAASGVGCGGATCGPNEYCRAPCSGTGFGFGGTTGLPMTPPMPFCYPLPAACNGTPTCDCICGLGSTFWCSTGSQPITSGPAVQCGCA